MRYLCGWSIRSSLDPPCSLSIVSLPSRSAISTAYSGLSFYFNLQLEGSPTNFKNDTGSMNFSSCQPSVSEGGRQGGRRGGPSISLAAKLRSLLSGRYRTCSMSHPDDVLLYYSKLSFAHRWRPVPAPSPLTMVLCTGLPLFFLPLIRKMSLTTTFRLFQSMGGNQTLAPT